MKVSDLLFAIGHDLVVSPEPLNLGVRVVGMDLHHHLAFLHGLHRLQLPREPDRTLCEE